MAWGLQQYGTDMYLESCIHCGVAPQGGVEDSIFQCCPFGWTCRCREHIVDVGCDYGENGLIGFQVGLEDSTFRTRRFAKDVGPTNPDVTGFAMAKLFCLNLTK